MDFSKSIRFPNSGRPDSQRKSPKIDSRRKSPKTVVNVSHESNENFSTPNASTSVTPISKYEPKNLKSPYTSPMSQKRILTEKNHLSNSVKKTSPQKKTDKPLPVSTNGSRPDSPYPLPYDPVANYTSLRPEFLRYDPNRKIEIMQRIEKAMFDDEEGLSPCTSNSSTSPQVSAEKETQEEEPSRPTSIITTAVPQVSSQPTSTITAVPSVPVSECGEEECLIDDDDEEEKEEGISYAKLVLKLFFLACFLSSVCHICSMSSNVGMKLHERISEVSMLGEFIGLSKMCLSRRNAENTCGIEEWAVAVEGAIPKVFDITGFTSEEEDVFTDGDVIGFAPDEEGVFTDGVIGSTPVEEEMFSEGDVIGSTPVEEEMFSEGDVIGSTPVEEEMFSDVIGFAPDEEGVFTDGDVIGSTPVEEEMFSEGDVIGSTPVEEEMFSDGDVIGATPEEEEMFGGGVVMDVRKETDEIEIGIGLLAQENIVKSSEVDSHVVGDTQILERSEASKMQVYLLYSMLALVACLSVLVALIAYLHKHTSKKFYRKKKQTPASETDVLKGSGALKKSTDNMSTPVAGNSKLDVIQTAEVDFLDESLLTDTTTVSRSSFKEVELQATEISQKELELQATPTTPIPEASLLKLERSTNQKESAKTGVSSLRRSSRLRSRLTYS